MINIITSFLVFFVYSAYTQVPEKSSPKFDLTTYEGRMEYRYQTLLNKGLQELNDVDKNIDSATAFKIAVKAAEDNYKFKIDTSGRAFLMGNNKEHWMIRCYKYNPEAINVLFNPQYSKHTTDSILKNNETIWVLVSKKSGQVLSMYKEKK